MSDFLSHPIWSFLGTICGFIAVILAWIAISERKKMKLRISLNKLFEKINTWIMAILCVIAFLAGNIAGEKSVLFVALEFSNFLALFISFVFTFSLIGISLVIRKKFF